jgi:hypothetical protein
VKRIRREKGVCDNEEVGEMCTRRTMEEERCR